MKKSILLRSALLLAAAGASVNAGAQIFQWNEAISKQLCPMHRAVPSIIDYNADGKMDLFYGGQNFENNESPWALPTTTAAGNDTIVGTGWFVQSILHTGLGEGNFQFGRVSATHQFENGNPGTALGLPPSTFGKTQWFDSNNDGTLDAFIFGRSEYGWNPNPETPGDHWYFMIYQNHANNSFTYLNNSMQMFPSGNNEIQENPEMGAGNISFGDYNNDGLQDILLQVYKKWFDEEGGEQGARFVGLYKNNGDGTFSEQKVFTPVAYEQCKKPAGLFNVDEETFEAVPTNVAKPSSKGAVAFGDFNNDGFLDIVQTGYGDDGPSFNIYKNNGDGTFQQIEMSEEYGAYECDVVLADYNNDGQLDIALFGAGDNQTFGHLLLNQGDFNFQKSSYQEGNGLNAVAYQPCARIADFNHDDLIDIVIRGCWMDAENNGHWGTVVYQQNADGTFTQVQDMGRDFGSGGFHIGDLDGDGTIDFVGSGYGGRANVGRFEGEGGDSYTDAYLGVNVDGVEAPEAPTEVSATAENGKLTVTFTGDESNLGYSYNVFVRNTETGWTAMLVPASIETGKLLVNEGLQVALRSTDPASISYTIAVPTDGTYEIGVQTIKPDFQTSAFVTTTVNAVTNGIATLKADTAQKTVKTIENGHVVIIKNGEKFNAVGQQIK